MREAFTFADEYLYAHTNDIVVDDFVCWRRSGKKGRVFQPYLRLRIRDNFYTIDGYHALWDFLDTLYPDLYRHELNACMKGDTEFAFLDEVAGLIREANMYLGMSYWAWYDYPLPNSKKTESLCNMIGDVWCADVETRDGEPHSLLMKISYNSECLSQMEVVRVGGMFPNIVLGKLDTHEIMCFVNHEDSHDFRPFKRTKFDTWEEFDSAFNFLHSLMCETDYSHIEASYDRYRRRTGMQYVERDIYEFGIFLEVAERNRKE